MKPQTIINIVFAVAFVGYVVLQRNPTFDKITCNAWRVVDADGETRVDAGTRVDGRVSVQWYDKDGKQRIGAGTRADGNASVSWFDKDEKHRIAAGTLADGQASVAWFDKDGKQRIAAATLADGDVVLPTQDDSPPKKP